MTVTVNQVTITTIMTYSAESRWTSLVLILTLLLIVLLVQQEMVRAYAGSRSATWIKVLNVAIVPLAVAYAFLLITYLLNLVYPF